MSIEFRNRQWYRNSSAKKKRKQPVEIVDGDELSRDDWGTSRSHPVTVCVACVSWGTEPYIFGATDRKITVDDETYEPDMPNKVWPLGVGIAALTAGDMVTQSEVCMNVVEVQPRTVKEAVKAYCEALIAVNRKHAERRILLPLNLTIREFLSDQELLNSDFGHTIQTGLARVRANVETIICGFDTRSGFQLYKIGPDACEEQFTNLGYTAIGEGGRHAESQFMYAKYSPNKTYEEAMAVIYAAKKRAEVASSVGKATEMFYIGRQGIKEMPRELMRELDERYEEAQGVRRLAERHTVESIIDFVKPPEDEANPSDLPRSPDSTEEPTSTEG